MIMPKTTNTLNDIPLYQQVKDYITGKIDNGAIKSGMKLES